jgi:hypothetical protein
MAHNEYHNQCSNILSLSIGTTIGLGKDGKESGEAKTSKRNKYIMQSYDFTVLESDIVRLLEHSK